MNPLTLHARNYRGFDTLDVDLPDGAVAILGDNGAGKSSIVEAVELALFGECRTGRLPAQLTTGVNDELLIELELEHGGDLYRIRRSYSPRGRGKTTLDLETFIDGAISLGQSAQWEPLTRASTRETQDAIEQTIGISHETFRASAFVAQKDGAAFTTAQPRDRKRILAAVLGLDRYDHLQEAAKTERRRLQEQHTELTGRVRAAEEQLAGRDIVTRERDQVVAAIVDSEDELADLEREHARLADRYQEAREQASKRDAAETTLRAAEQEHERLHAIAARGGEISMQIAAARGGLKDLADTAGDVADLERQEAGLQQQLDEHVRLSHARDLALAEHDRLLKRRDDLVAEVNASDARAESVRARIADTQEQADATCDVCGQHLDTDAKAKAIAVYTLELERHLARSKELYEETRAIVMPEVPPGMPPAPTVELAAVRDRLRVVREQATRRATLEERIRQLHAELDTHPHNLTDLKVAAAAGVETAKKTVARLEPVDLDEVTRAGTLAKRRLETARATVEQQRTLRARLDERLAQIATAETAWRETTADRDLLETQINVVHQLERAFGRDGIPALILENSAIPAIEVEANRVLDEIRNKKLEGARIELHTQADLKSGDGVRETLDVVIVTEQGARPYETFSGGEETRLDLALRIALARLLATRRGAESKLLVVDEPDGLDEHGMAALVDVLRGLQGDFEKLYVVSHVPALRDSFDTTLTVAGGRVVEDGLFETVTV